MDRKRFACAVRDGVHQKRVVLRGRFWVWEGCPYPGAPGRAGRPSHPHGCWEPPAVVLG